MSEREPRVVVEGGQGREHAIGAAMQACDARVFVAPGNAGTRGDGYLSRRPGNPDLIILGPEALIIDGRRDQLEAMGFAGRVLAVNQETSFLEGSKVEADEFMTDCGILHPPGRVATDYEEALKAINGKYTHDIVFKADKPANGHGVVLPSTRPESIRTIRGMLSGDLFNSAGQERFLIQERWHGPELSVFTVGDGNGHHYVLPFFVEDFKRLEDGNKGPNTGSMGARSLALDRLTERQLQKIYEIIDKTYSGLARYGYDSKGFLFFGLMLAEEHDGDPALLEWNVRQGQPEAQVEMPLMTDAGIDTYDLFRSAAAGNLRPDDFPRPDQVLGRAAVTVTMAAEGYPNSDKVVTGAEIVGLDEEYEGAMFYHGGTVRRSGKILNTTGRAGYATGIGNDTAEAGAKTYGSLKPPDPKDPRQEIDEMATGIHMMKNGKRVDVYRTDIAAGINAA